MIPAALAMLAAVLFIPYLRRLFHFSVLHPIDLAVCLGAGVLSVLWFEGYKMWARRHMAKLRKVPAQRTNIASASVAPGKRVRKPKRRRPKKRGKR
jgi:hypothetical protein